MSTIVRPELRRVGLRTQLYVDGRPFLALGGELGNSNASDLGVLEAALDKCRRMNLNTIMLPVYWDLIEPREGEFNFALVQGAIDLARARGLRLVPLWFGTWKNSMSCYAPGWVKRDTARFARVRRSSGEFEEIISPQCTAANESDVRAFARLMRFLRDYDATTATVIMVQVENEIGMIPEVRDHSDTANAAFASAVPESLLALACEGQLGPEVAAMWESAGRRAAGSWAEVFGPGPAGEEVFSAWQFATYVDKIAAAGKREYTLPMFTNAALIRPGYQPGQYPSAGPLPHLLEIWRAGAPSLDMICPDIYFPNFIEWCAKYDRNENPVFIPEMAATMRASANAVFAAARHGAIGFGPFSIENVEGEKERLITNCYAALAGLSEMILDAQQRGTILGLSPKVGFDWSFDESLQTGDLGGIAFKAVFDRQDVGGETQTTTLPTLGAGRWDAPPGTPHGAAMIIQQSPEEFVVLGMGVKITLAPADGRGKVGIDQVQEGRFAPGSVWEGRRFLNGDETHQGRHIHLPDGAWMVQRIRLYRY